MTVHYSDVCLWTKVVGPKRTSDPIQNILEMVTVGSLAQLYKATDGCKLTAGRPNVAVSTQLRHIGVEPLPADRATGNLQSVGLDIGPGNATVTISRMFWIGSDVRFLDQPLVQTYVR